jgi:hypothetical protein
MEVWFAIENPCVCQALSAKAVMVAKWAGHVTCDGG